MPNIHVCTSAEQYTWVCSAVTRLALTCCASPHPMSPPRPPPTPARRGGVNAEHGAGGAAARRVPHALHAPPAEVHRDRPAGAGRDGSQRPGTGRDRGGLFGWRGAGAPSGGKHMAGGSAWCCSSWLCTFRRPPCCDLSLWAWGHLRGHFKQTSAVYLCRLVALVLAPGLSAAACAHAALAATTPPSLW